MSFIRASLVVVRSYRRLFSTAPEISDAQESCASPSTAPSARIRRIKAPSSSLKDAESFPLPDNLDVLWSHHPYTSPDYLPQPENFQEALNNLLISLHPQTQHRATYSSPLGPLTEPSLGLYCPIEGGDYIIDATVRELARLTRSEVLVLDAVHLAAGEWGNFGPAANSLSLPRNPLHFPTQLPRSPYPSLSDEYEDQERCQLSLPPRMTLTLVPQPILNTRAIVSTPSRRPSPPSRVKVFFDTLVNLSSDPSSSKGRPRVIYVRDFSTLSCSSSFWYPPLLSAVRERRRGPISRPSSPVSNPMSIIFGMSSSLTPPNTSTSTGLLSWFTNRPSSTHVSNEFKLCKPADWGEGEAADVAREKRLGEKLRKWNKGESYLFEDIPKLSMSYEGNCQQEGISDVILVAPPGIASASGLSSSVLSHSQPNVSFFRTSVLFPRSRSLSKEQEVRVARRREINELTMRMGIGAAGGILERDKPSASLSESSRRISLLENSGIPRQDEIPSMWKDWGNKIESWSNVRRIADHALGKTLMEEKAFGRFDEDTLDSTSVPWTAVRDAWDIHQSSKDLQRSWLKGATNSEEGEDGKRRTIDSVIETIKRDENLDSHEFKLLSCIVDAASMPTSFDQVHLPPHTIDSLRTIVSLPLLHPHAFQQGILKDHAMTGCLLFGPPGTGKTLVVRALAKEAGCRMLTISPSDVMDMYVGEGEKLVRAVFTLARKLTPCVVFLDEIDALFGSRMSGRDTGGAFAHRGVITEFMQEMDGLKTSKEDRVIVIGATNRPFDLDDAVLRRLPRRLLVDLPGEKERAEILKILLSKEILSDDINVDTLAKQTESFSGSDLKHLCVSAALDAVKEKLLLPWPTSELQPGSLTPVSDEQVQSVARRVLCLLNFSKALKEITPSSSESLGSLAELRKWNDEFGEGKRNRKRQQFWGKGRFGFTNKQQQEEDGKVLPYLSEIDTA